MNYCSETRPSVSLLPSVTCEVLEDIRIRASLGRQLGILLVFGNRVQRTQGDPFLPC